MNEQTQWVGLKIARKLSKIGSDQHVYALGKDGVIRTQKDATGHYQFNREDLERWGKGDEMTHRAMREAAGAVGKRGYSKKPVPKAIEPKDSNGHATTERSPSTRGLQEWLSQGVKRGWIDASEAIDLAISFGKRSR